MSCIAKGILISNHLDGVTTITPDACILIDSFNNKIFFQTGNCCSVSSSIEKSDGIIKYTFEVESDLFGNYTGLGEISWRPTTVLGKQYLHIDYTTSRGSIGKAYLTCFKDIDTNYIPFMIDEDNIDLMEVNKAYGLGA